MKVIITPKAQKEYAKIPKVEQKKVKRKLIVIQQNPLSGKKLDGEFEELRAVRAWPYRIFFYIDKIKETIYIVSIKHRQGAYK